MDNFFTYVINVCNVVIVVELIVFELGLFSQKYPKIKFSNGILHSKQVITAMLVYLIHFKSHLNTLPT